MAHSVATPALLCHTTTRGISCLSLVLYGIRIGSEDLEGPVLGRQQDGGIVLIKYLVKPVVSIS